MQQLGAKFGCAESQQPLQTTQQNLISQLRKHGSTGIQVSVYEITYSRQLIIPFVLLGRGCWASVLYDCSPWLLHNVAFHKNVVSYLKPALYEVFGNAFAIMNG